jgi:serine/threonine protein kinase
MYDIPVGKAFARKLIRIPQVDSQVVDNEVHALKVLCKEGHPNIVSVLQIGELRNSQDLFIDMELCDLNLTEYIRGPWRSAADLPCQKPNPSNAREANLECHAANYHWGSVLA